MEKRLRLSLIALIGSVILFVVTSLAWFTISEFVNIDFFPGSVSGLDIDYKLYKSSDDSNYIEVSSISFENTVPGDITYYRLVIENPQTEDINARVYLSGLIDFMTDGSSYTPGYSLSEVVYLSSKRNSIPLESGNLDTLLIAGLVMVSDSFVISGSSQETIDFSFEILGTAGNAYQNLGIEIDSIKIFFDNQ